MKKLIKLTLLMHRYLGFALSLLFVIWFLSGFAMMYVKYPTMRYHERLQRLPAPGFSKAHLTIAQALDSAGIKDTLRSIRLGMLLNRPIYRVTTIKGTYQAVFADNGEQFNGADTALAARLAMQFTKGEKIKSIELLTEIDQWMAAARSQGYTTPVYRVHMYDTARTYVYVAAQTGEVVQMVNAKQRFLAWLGPIPHWIYPTVLLRNRPLWNDIVVWSSTIGSIMCIAGIAMGFVRYKRSRGIAFSPYKKKWFRWHHYTGFAFGLFVFTWVFSGLLSMTPWDWAPFTRLEPEESVVWTGGILDTRRFSISPAAAAGKLGTEFGQKEIQLVQWNGTPYYLGYADEHHTRLLAADEETSVPVTQLPSEPFISKLKEMNAAIPVKEAVMLHEYDDYYYSKNHEKRLPVLRVKMASEDEKWYYVDPATAQVVLKHQDLSRLERWLYHGLHSFDFRFLVYKRPLWDIVVIVLMIGGTLVSMTGLVLTFKWVGRKF
ncbi:PepSY-associated TM region [Dyadobacter sp. SG02]|uniref:PepSY domain-containing protein n=1 Tax=Dyadobacter sp. SG02 TaxID=1855291 RepID=UPI0008ABBE3B|nr:PepSY domain-containing protein [Dyadobacter sp. SG02]SEI38284.1 PepSY-associated TM region [Dyadobacter sp. SG02]